ncbi:hypothetical protein [Streptomyces sp. NPDC001530]
MHSRCGGDGVLALLVLKGDVGGAGHVEQLGVRWPAVVDRARQIVVG